MSFSYFMQLDMLLLLGLAIPLVFLDNPATPAMSALKGVVSLLMLLVMSAALLWIEPFVMEGVCAGGSCVCAFGRRL